MHEIFTPTEKIENCADACVQRIHEVGEYQNNINRFTSMVGELPSGDLPDNLKPFLDLPPEQVPASVDLADFIKVGKHRLRREMQDRIRSEHIQMMKSEAIRAAIDAELPAETREADLAAAVIRRNDILAAARIPK
jgi:hypothetical protein